MQNQAPTQAVGHTIASKSEGNPEGKGVSEFLRDRDRSSPIGVTAKPQRQLLGELFASMLVLSARFGFRPVVGKSTYLYWIRDEWSLSLIAPEEWSDERQAAFAGTCVLKPDMTWAILPSKWLTDSHPALDAFRRFYEAFTEALDTDLTLEEILPFYVGQLPYYQRLYASALSRSINLSLMLGGQESISCRQWPELVSTSSHEVPQLLKPEQTITDFSANSPDLDWFVLNDSVMGGKSNGSFTLREGVLTFTGKTNTDGGGFSSIRTKPLQLDLSSHAGIRLRVKGDGRRYTWRLTTSAEHRGKQVSYRADFEPGSDSWVSVDIPFSSFVPKFRGKRLDGPQIDTTDITGMGLMIYDEQDGFFELELANVSAYGPGSVQQMQ